ncbi:Hypothetical predicted protein [Cloeon dipterum]|uniref:Uncharacterized protein n=1 Tax=Cloeon dipterum TaxID=197152 RepID=A0A8S1DBG6_9INSE|nr:Hypothetical predicted protein [Cloeon dipterum]
MVRASERPSESSTWRGPCLAFGGCGGLSEPCLLLTVLSPRLDAFWLASSPRRSAACVSFSLAEKSQHRPLHRTDSVSYCEIACRDGGGPKMRRCIGTGDQLKEQLVAARGMKRVGNWQRIALTFA